MVRFDDLSPKEQKQRMAALERDLELNPPTPEQSMYFRFTSANKGFEWIDRITAELIPNL